MLLHCILFCFCFATSIGFHFDDITANATAYTPFALTWHLDQGEDPDELHLKQRSITQNSGDGQPIDFSFPDNGTHSGTVSVNFTAPGEYLVEVFRGNSESPDGGTSGTISVGGLNPGIKPTPTTASTSTSIALSSTVTSNASAAVSIFSTSSNYSSTDSSLSSSFEPSSILSTEGFPSPTSSSGITRTTTSTTSMNTAVTTSSGSNDTGSTTISVSSVSPSSAIGSPSKTLIVGATVGSFAFLLLLLASLVYTLRRWQWRRKKYPAIFHRDRMVRKRSNSSFSPLTPTTKDPETYTNSADVEKHASCGSTYKDDLAPSPQPQKGSLEYSLPAPLAPRSETPSPIPAHTDRQMEIYDVLVKKNTDLIRLKTELRRGGDVQEEIEGLKATIKGLEEALVSPWALGYADEMPNEVSRALIPN